MRRACCCMLLCLLCLVAAGRAAIPGDKGERDAGSPSAELAMAASLSSKETRPALLSISDNAFHLNDERFTLLSGEIHYFRIPHQYWRDRLRRIRSLGFNAVTVYVPWNYHQPSSSISDPLSFDFSGDRNLTRFLDLAVAEDLFVVMRAPPYICAEWDFGGLPAWLADPNSVPGGGTMQLRSSRPPFLSAVESWYSELLPRLRPYLLENGGPILMVQIENEFGNVGEPDVDYLKALAKTTREHLDSSEVFLFTTDAPRFVVNGSVPFEKNDDERFVAMVDSGAGWNATDLDLTFAPLKTQINAPGKTPFFSSELYDGWVQFNGVSWNDASNVSVSRFVGKMRGLLDKGSGGEDGRVGGGGGVSLYMAAGGSNFGFWAGGAAGDEDTFSAIIQSYDYAAPISEGGSMDEQPGYGGDKRASAVRDLLQKYSSLATTPSALSSSRRGQTPSSPPLPPPMPPNPPVASYGVASLTQRAPLAAALHQLSSNPGPIASPKPFPMENFGQQRGFIAYSCRIPLGDLSVAGSEGALFEVGGGGAVHDLGTVLVDGVSQGTLDRSKGAGVEGGSKLRLRSSSPSSSSNDNKTAELTVIVGMTGRSNQGTFFDTKGLNGSVLLDGKEVDAEWEVFTMPFDDVSQVEAVDLDAIAVASSGNEKTPFTVETSGPLLLRGAFSVSEEQAVASSIGEWEEERGSEVEAGQESSTSGHLRRRRRHPADTYLDFRGLSRGVAFVNGRVLGWYDLPEGPQMRIYVPGVWLRKGRNDVMVLEMLSASDDAAVATVGVPDFFGPKENKKETTKNKASAAAATTTTTDAASVLETEESLLRFPGAGSLRTEAQASSTTFR